MGTHATYKVGNYKFFTHYDGDESGVADRFLNAINAMTKPDAKALGKIVDARGGFAFALIRGNNDIEPENGVEGDYHYEVKEVGNGEITVTVESRKGTFYTEDLATFVNKNYEGHRNPENEVVRVEMINSYSGTWYTYVTKANAREIGELLKSFSEGFQDWNQNKKKYLKESEAFLQASI